MTINDHIKLKIKWLTAILVAEGKKAKNDKA